MKVSQIRQQVYKTNNLDVLLDSAIRVEGLYVTAYGIAWALQTGRTTAAAAIAIRGMKFSQLCTLLSQVSEHCQYIGDVPKFLNQRFANDHEPPG